MMGKKILMNDVLKNEDDSHDRKSEIYMNLKTKFRKWCESEKYMNQTRMITFFENSTNHVVTLLFCIFCVTNLVDFLNFSTNFDAAHRHLLHKIKISFFHSKDQLEHLGGRLQGVLRNDKGDVILSCCKKLWGMDASGAESCTILRGINICREWISSTLILGDLAKIS